MLQSRFMFSLHSFLDLLPGTVIGDTRPIFSLAYIPKTQFSKKSERKDFLIRFFHLMKNMINSH